MDPAAYQTWWGLHLRVACGEALGPEERALYEAGRTELERQEVLADPTADLREARASVAVLQAEHNVLEARRQHLEAEIARLEAALRQQGQRVASAGSGDLLPEPVWPGLSPRSPGL